MRRGRQNFTIHAARDSKQVSHPWKKNISFLASHEHCLVYEHLNGPQGDASGLLIDNGLCVRLSVFDQIRATFVSATQPWMHRDDQAASFFVNRLLAFWKRVLHLFACFRYNIFSLASTRSKCAKTMPVSNRTFRGPATRCRRSSERLLRVFNVFGKVTLLIS